MSNKRTDRPTSVSHNYDGDLKRNLHRSYLRFEESILMNSDVCFDFSYVKSSAADENKRVHAITERPNGNESRQWYTMTSHTTVALTFD